MKINQTQTACDHYNNPTFQYRVVSPQEALILDHVRKVRNYTITELAYLTKLDKSSVSGRRNAMLKKGLLVYGPKRKCKFTEIFVQTVKLP